VETKVTGFVYLATARPFCKVGFTNDPKRRSLELYCPRFRGTRRFHVPIKMIWDVGEHARAVEKAVILAMFPDYPFASTQEWFAAGLDEMCVVVGRCVERVTGRPIPAQVPKLKSWTDKYCKTNASLRRRFT
jgi:hypothetical protein